MFILMTSLAESDQVCLLVRPEMREVDDVMNIKTDIRDIASLTCVAVQAPNTRCNFVPVRRIAPSPRPVVVKQPSSVGTYALEIS